MNMLVVDPDFEEQVLSSIQACVQDGVLRTFEYFLTPPLFLDSNDSPLLCHEPVEETRLVAAHVSARIHAFYKHVSAFHARLKNLVAPV